MNKPKIEIMDAIKKAFVTFGVMIAMFLAQSLVDPLAAVKQLGYLTSHIISSFEEGYNSK